MVTCDEVLLTEIRGCVNNTDSYQIWHHLPRPEQFAHVDDVLSLLAFMWDKDTASQVGHMHSLIVLQMAVRYSATKSHHEEAWRIDTVTK